MYLFIILIGLNCLQLFSILRVTTYFDCSRHFCFEMILYDFHCSVQF